MQTWRMDMWALSGKRRVRPTGSVGLTYIDYSVPNGEWEAAMWHRKLKSVVYVDLEGQDQGSGVGGRLKGEGIYVFILLIHFIV